MSLSRMRRFGRLLPAVVALACTTSDGARAAAAVAAEQAKPNIVLILTDDEDVAIHEFMPKTRALLERRGVRFENFFVSYSFCCPSRASILRGQYAHNTQIVGNELPYGGFEKLHERGLERSTVATWLRDAGYHTALLGKYINRYVPETDGVPPGWSEWYVGGNAHPSYDYTLNENGRIVAYGREPKDYLGDVLSRKAVGIIEATARRAQPFFLYVSTYTPHSPAVSPPRHQDLFVDAELPRPPAFDEADVGDKPAVVRSFPPLDGPAIAWLEDEYRRRVRSLQAVDDMVEAIIDALERTGTLDSTYVIYTSDNGFHMGEHRMIAGKDTSYEEDIRVPMVMRGPGVPQGGRIDAMALNIDFAPTFADIAGIEAPDFVDGRSLLPLLDDPAVAWRQSFLIERRQLEEQYIDLAERQGATPEQLARHAYLDGLRTARWSYVEYGSGERELYDLANDPHQLDNVVERADPDLVAALSWRLAALAGCGGRSCRELEDLPLSNDQIHPAAVQK
jgi:N-acetylglucosamine-6-sulfatase